jgi:hypothetical protein
MLSPGNTDGITMVSALMKAAGPIELLLADRDYDASHLRHSLAH